MLTFFHGSLQELTGGHGVDIAVEALGRPQTFMQCVNSVKDGGKAVMIGLSKAGAVGEVDINRLVRRKVHSILHAIWLNLSMNLFVLSFNSFLNSSLDADKSDRFLRCEGETGSSKVG